MSKRSERLQSSEEKIDIKCKSVKCSENKHSYAPAPGKEGTRRKFLEAAGMGDAPSLKTPHRAGTCWACGDDSVNWDEVHTRRMPFEALKGILRHEYIRDEFWTRPIDAEALKKARERGFGETMNRVRKRILGYIAKAEPFRDGTQTPFYGEVYFYAQHATGTCCRKCLKLWHGIELGRPLTDEEVAYVETLIASYLRERSGEIQFPDLLQTDLELPQ